MHSVPKIRVVKKGERQLRLLFVARRYWPAIGGVESYLRHLARELGAHHEVTVLAHRIDDGPSERLTDSLVPPPPFEPFDDGPVRITPLRVSRKRRALMAPLVADVVPVLRRYAYGRVRITAAALYANVVGPVIAAGARESDVVHMWGGDLVAAAAMRAARLVGASGVVTPFAHANQYGTGPADVFAYRAADRVVSLLETEAELYRSLGVAAERIAVCGVASPGVTAGHGARIRRHYSIDGPLVLFLGVRRAYKGFGLLLQSAPLVARSRPDATFAFVGPGERVDELPSPARVIDAGVVDEDDRAGWLEAADVLCLPSEAEIFPGSFLEAWSVGTPVLASDIPTLSELVEKSRGGWTVARSPEAIGHRIIELLASPNRLRDCGENGRSFWERTCSVAAVASWHEQLFASLGRGRDGVPVETRSSEAVRT
jgi:glycosyltransferase involved in cell wall biosynthesis